MTNIKPYLDIFARMASETLVNYRDLLETYLYDYSQLNHSTLRRYSYTLAEFFAYLESKKIKLGKITVAIMNDYFNEKLKTCHLSTINNQFTIIFPFLKHLFHKKVIDDDTWRELEYKQSRYPKAKGKRRREVFQNGEQDLLINSIENPRARMIIWIFHHYALRPIELRHLKEEHIDLNNRILYILDSKHHRSRSIPIPEGHIPEWVGWFEQKRIIYPLSSYIIPNERKHKAPLGERRMYEITRSINKVLDRNIYPYLFRRSTATDAARQGVPLETLRDILGHSNISITNDYVNPEEEDVREDWLNYKESKSKSKSEDE